MIIGIDPDAAGGICETSGYYYHYEPLCFTDAESNRDVLRKLCTEGRVVYVEAIPLIPGNGRVGMMSRSKRYGAMIERLRMLGVRVVEVYPVTWQAALGLTAGKGEGRKAHKARMAKVARRFCPDVPDALADAVLIAYYGLSMEARHGSAD